jgi:hypothetical protein
MREERMGGVLYNLNDKGKKMYMFSEDLLSGVRFFGHLAENCEGQQERIHFNTSCVFFAGSYLESVINELISRVANTDSETTKPYMQLWKTLDISQKDMPFKKKWDLIASIYGQNSHWQRCHLSGKWGKLSLLSLTSAIEVFPSASCNEWTLVHLSTMTAFGSQ